MTQAQLNQSWMLTELSIILVAVSVVLTALAVIVAIVGTAGVRMIHVAAVRKAREAADEKVQAHIDGEDLHATIRAEVDRRARAEADQVFEDLKQQEPEGGFHPGEAEGDAHGYDRSTS